MNELEAIHNIALVGYEQKSTVMSCSLTILLLWGHFGAELNAAAENASNFSPTKCGEIISRICLASVSRERTLYLAVRIISEIVIARRVSSESGVISLVRDVNRGACH